MYDIILKGCRLFNGDKFADKETDVAILDGVIQAVITDENSDVDSLTKTAVNDFQKNHLDNLN